MSSAPLPDPAALGPAPVAPSAEAWASLSPAAREAFLIEANTYLSDPRLTMTEGRPHTLAKQRFADLIGLHFRTLGKPIYLAEDLAVHYPREEVFSPDVLAVLGVAQPPDDTRLAWVVLEERRGLDLVLEVLHNGDRKKDLTTNVARYARLGIPEYFVYDRARQRLHGFRLERPGEYVAIVPQHGRVRSSVLELDLAIVEGSLRVFAGVAELIGTEELVNRMQGMLDRATQDVDAAQASAAQAQASAVQAQASAAQAQASANDARLVALRSALLVVLDARALGVDDAARARIEGCADEATLRDWVTRAATVAQLADVF